MTAAVLILASFVAAGPYTDVFHEAARAYEQANYPLAIQLYEQLVREDVVEPAVFYNLGNAYFRAGHVGPAIANYERALQLNPAYPAARDNLAAALQQIPRNLERPQPPEWESSLLFWHYGLSFRTVVWLAIVSWCIVWVLLALRTWKSVPYARGGAIVAAVLAIGFVASAWNKSHPRSLAVASRPVVTVRYLPQDDEPARYELYEGDRVRVTGARDAWVMVETASGERGWAPMAEMTLVGPPYRPFEGPTEVESIEEELDIDHP